MRHRWDKIALAALLGSACGSDPATRVVLAPDGITCAAATFVVTGTDELRSALASASDGDCVIAGAGTYEGPFELSVAGLTVAGGRDEAVTLFAPAGAGSVVRITGERVVLAALRVSGGTHGVRVSAPAVRLQDVTVVDAGDIGVAIKCEDQGCLHETGRTQLTGVVVERGRTGFFAARGRVRVDGGAFTGAMSLTVAGGAGAGVFDGAFVEMYGTTISGNQYGLVIDGATTRVAVEDVVILDNEEVGLWAQNLDGTLAAPGLEIRGAATRINGNAITGVGLYNSAGVMFTGGEVSGTLIRNVSINAAETADVGDGVGLFSGTRDVMIQGVRLDGNQRSQALVDAGRENIVFDAANDVLAGQDEYKVVVQNTLFTVEVPPEDRSTAPTLPVRVLAIAAPAL